MRTNFSQVLLGLLALSAGALLVLGPRPKVDAPPGRVRIQYWEKWTGQEAQQLQQIVDWFNNTVGKEKNIWVDLVSMSQIEQKTLIATAGGVPPDVAGLFDTQICQYASKGVLEPLDEYARARGMTRDYFKPAFYDGCTYQGHLYALPSTPWVPALFWNKQIFEDRAANLRAAGFDATRPPRTIDELDRYAAVLDAWASSRNGSRRLVRSGYVPLEPGWWIQETVWWFGGDIVDKSGTHVLLTSPEWVRTFDWLRGYSQRVGKDALENFRSGFGNFDSPQNAFLTGQAGMVMQGPWMFSFIEKLNPSMNRWHVPEDQFERERAFAQIRPGMTTAQVKAALGEPVEAAGNNWRWLGGPKVLFATIADDRVVETHWNYLPARERQKYCQWGVAAFPSIRTDLKDVTYAGTDTLVIPRSGVHKKEAFEFVAFMDRQDVIERLNSLQCKPSPLANVSEGFRRDHPNPYIDVFERLAASANAHPVPHVIIWPELTDEIRQAAQRAVLLEAPSKELLEQSQFRAQRSLDRALME